jgi:hypothetical protein
MHCAEDFLRDRIVQSADRRTAACPSLSTTLALCGGALLAGIGVSKLLRVPNSWGGVLATGLGGTLAYRGWREWNREQGHEMFDEEQMAGYVAGNPVDESSWESFPASDAPARRQPTAW